MIHLRSVLAAPFRLSSIDLLAAVAIALMAFSLAVGPALAQDGSPSPAGDPSPIATAPADATSEPVPSLTVAPAPPASAPPTANPTPSAAPALTPATGGATPAPSPSPTLMPGASTTGDPCAPTPTPDPSATPNPDATAAPKPNLCPAQPNGADPLALLAWIFTPIFQVIFIGLAFLYSVTGDIGIAIILLTIVIRTLLIPVFRRQIVSQRRMQMLQPELRAIQVKYKGDRQKISEEQMKLYRDRGVNPASGCLPAVLQLVLLLPMYQVFMQGLNAPDISSMLHPFGIQLVNVQCQDPGNPYVPCIDPNIPWLGWLPKIDDGLQLPGYPGGLPSNEPEIFLMLLTGLGFGISLLAVASALLQLVQSRMMMNRNIAAGDTTAMTTNRMMLILPLFSIIYGAILPAGLFIYWITTTVFSIVQQFLINGFGGLFPLFGWTPRLAAEFVAPFPVTMPEPKPAEPEKRDGTSTTTKRSTKESAAGTIRPARRRSRRRGRRR